MADNGVKKRNRNGPIPAYTPDMKMSLVRRIAHYLFWCATHRPYEFIPYKDITKAILGFDHGIRDDNPQLKVVKGTCYRSRKILHDEYSRGYATLRFHGVRCTVDDNDRVIATMPQATIRLQGAVTNYKEQAQAINVANVTNPIAKKWMIGPVKQLVNTMGDQFMKQLTPPKDEEN